MALSNSSLQSWILVKYKAEVKSKLSSAYFKFSAGQTQVLGADLGVLAVRKIFDAPKLKV